MFFTILKLPLVFVVKKKVGTEYYVTFIMILMMGLLAFVGMNCLAIG